MQICNNCVLYDETKTRQCTAYNNECEPNEDATHCCEYTERKVMDAIKVKPYDESSKFKDAKCNCIDDNGLVFNQKIDGCYSSAREAEDAFETVGIIIRAKINRLCNEEKFDEAKELEEALIKINTADYNH